MAVGPDYISQGLLDTLCDYISDGKSVREFFRSERTDVSRSRFYNWLDQHGTEDQKHQYARACEDRHDAIFEECLDIADETKNDTITTEYGDKPNAEWISRSRLRVDTRLKMLARMNPKKYSETVKQELTGKDGGPIQASGVIVTLDDAKVISQALDDEC